MSRPSMNRHARALPEFQLRGNLVALTEVNSVASKEGAP
jgi:hypothetical protein